MTGARCPGGEQEDKGYDALVKDWMEKKYTLRYTGTQHTCLAGTNVQILTQKVRQAGSCRTCTSASPKRWASSPTPPPRCTQFTCFASTKVQILTREELLQASPAKLRVAFEVAPWAMLIEKVAGHKLLVHEAISY